jgi:hypothetical protein
MAIKQNVKPDDASEYDREMNGSIMSMVEGTDEGVEEAGSPRSPSGEEQTLVGSVDKVEKDAQNVPLDQTPNMLQVMEARMNLALQVVNELFYPDTTGTPQGTQKKKTPAETEEAIKKSKRKKKALIALNVYLILAR